METTIVYWGCIWIMEKKMEAKPRDEPNLGLLRRGTFDRTYPPAKTAACVDGRAQEDANNKTPQPHATSLWGCLRTTHQLCKMKGYLNIA